MFYIRSYDRFLDVVKLDDKECIYKSFNKSKIIYWLVFIFDNLLKINTISNFFKSHYIDKQFVDLSNKNLDGVYSFLNKHFIALYVNDHKLYLCIEKNKYQVTDELTVVVSGIAKNRFFILKRSTTILKKIHYSISGDHIEDDSITIGAEDEDFDFGLFIKNILGNKNRQNMFISQRML